MGILVVSGLSGAGKSVAMAALEDLGYYCVDNLPVSLLASFIEGLDNDVAGTAVSLGARNLRSVGDDISHRIDELRSAGLIQEIFFLEAVDEVLLKRFSETRRRHPLSGNDRTLAEALTVERELLGRIRERADAVIDTTLINLHQLRDLIRSRLRGHAQGNLTLLFESFGFKHGIPPTADLVFDARFLPNPHWQPELRRLNGRDTAVGQYLDGQPVFKEFLEDIVGLLERWVPRFEGDRRAYLTVAIGCTGGQHRSVYAVECLTAHFRQLGGEVMSRHREIKDADK
ncbi:MAG: RNase adapter RapZ [Chromatiales bacterium]|nr:RNase adapter RapZ [Chromatiales bacterium]